LDLQLTKARALKHPGRWATQAAVGAAAGLLLTVPSASADLLGETVAKVTSSLPQVSAPQLPPPPVVAPTNPSVEVTPAPVPRASAGASEASAAAPPEAPAPTSGRSGDSSPEGIGALAGTVARVTTGDTEGVGIPVDQAPEPSGDGPQATASGTTDIAGPTTSAPSSKGRALSSHPRRVDPFSRWLAYIWPAIALGPFERFMVAPARRLLAALRPATADGGPGLFPHLTATEAAGSAAGASRSAAIGGDSPSADPRIPFAAGAALPLFVLFISAAALMALLAASVRRELGSIHRWWPH
jgi:hypothetical protein